MSHPAIAVATLALLTLAPLAPALAGGAGTMPQDTMAKMYRLQAQQNRETGQRNASAQSGDDGYAATGYANSGASAGTGSTGLANGGVGNLTIGDFSQSNNRSLREVNIVVDGDIINLNRGH